MGPGQKDPCVLGVDLCDTLIPVCSASGLMKCAGLRDKRENVLSGIPRAVTEDQPLLPGNQQRDEKEDIILKLFRLDIRSNFFTERVVRH